MRNTSVLLSSTTRISGAMALDHASGKVKWKADPASRFGFDPDPPIMAFHNPLAEGKSNSRAGILIACVQSFE